MMKKNLKLMILTSAVILLPILAGVILWRSEEHTSELQSL